MLGADVFYLVVRRGLRSYGYIMFPIKWEAKGLGLRRVSESF